MNFEISPYGADHILIQFEQRVDQAINAQVHQLKVALDSDRIKGVVQVVPAYCSLMIGFDSKLIKRQSLIKKIGQLKMEEENYSKSLLYRLPVCYDGEFAPDMQEVMEMTALTQDEIVEQHTQSIYHTFMIGFLPGFPYMGKLSSELKVPRKSTARVKVPLGSVGLAGDQTGIYPGEAPGGWQIIGRTPVPMFNRHWAKPALLEEGDQVQFFPISAQDFRLIDRDIQSGQFNFKSLHVW